ncbi:RING/U-box superfamily protein [Rhynchospora pubera]|uniref:RING/U-box superfamily protein n=1 Tax=Rhynchospora pubera TaxID=906938 RepID=A0AAV8HJE9_9POAL|nr:RING/U-box superfamily protein [Rhynchospora pubera]
MGGHHRDRSSRSGRKLRAATRHSSSSAAATASDHSTHPTPPSVPDPTYPNPDPDHSRPDPDPIYHDSDCGYCTEEQLEDLLLKNLDFAYNEALSRLTSLGYSADVALHGVLCGGHCCGPADVISNIVTNTVDYLNNPSAVTGSGSASSSATGGGGFAGFSDLRALEEYSLAGMVCLVKQHRPGISRGDAMWCLLMGDLHVGRACQIELPPPNCCTSAALAYQPAAEAAAAAAAAAGDLRYDPATSGFRPFTRMKTVGPNGGAKSGSYGSEDFIDGLMKELEMLQLEDKSTDSDDQNDRVLDMFCQARELEEQVKERREWAHQKALQAAQRLSRDMAELRALRVEKERRERMKKAGTPAVSLDEGTVKRLVEMEEGLKKASLQVDKANAEVQRLEAENAEIRAEMEAAKLSAAESTRTQQEAAKREKRVRKKSQTRDRQRQQLQDEINEARHRQSQLQKEIDDTCKSTKETELLLKEEKKAKEEATVQLEELTKSTEATKATFRRRIDSLRQKIELDTQRYRDDIRRLQEEHARLLSQTTRTAVSSAITNYSPPSLEVGNKNGRVEQPERKTIGRRWQCVACVKDEVSVLLLPCKHQVLCVACNESHVSMGKARCPCCNAAIEERIRVYGVST